MIMFTTQTTADIVDTVIVGSVSLVYGDVIILNRAYPAEISISRTQLKLTKQQLKKLLTWLQLLMSDAIECFVLSIEEVKKKALEIRGKKVEQT